MSAMLSQLRAVAENLHALTDQWALVGALAVSVYTEPRTTRDIDVAVAINTDEMRGLVLKLQERGFRNPTALIHAMPTHKLGMRLHVPTPAGPSVALDLLHSSSGIESEIVSAALKLEVFPKLFIPVASIGHLIAMKLLSQDDSDRIKDRVDLQQLLAAASAEDLIAAEIAIDLIGQRGFARGRDLRALLADSKSSFTAVK